MQRTSFCLLGLGLVAVFGSASALDINPSKNNQPPSFWQSSGNRFSIFNGDPKRIQRANEIDPKAFDSTVVVTPSSFSIKALKSVAPNPSLKITLAVHNHGKKTFTLSFPTAQRWDFRILNSAGTPIYVYSDNCEFEQKVGSSMVNADDKLVYSESVDFDDMSPAIEPGVYTLQAVMANYPEMHAQAQLTVQP